MDRKEGEPVINNQRVDPLLNDLATVEKTRFATSDTDHKIRSFEATPGEIRNWYFAQDPLDELKHVTALATIASGNKEAALGYLTVQAEERYTYEAAAAGLAASVFVPHVFSDNPHETYHRLEQAFATVTPNNFVITHPDAPLSIDDILHLSLQQGKGKLLNEDEVDRIYSAAEMLSIAASMGHGTSTIQGRPQAPQPARLDTYFSDKLYGIVMANCLKQGASLDLQLTGLDAQWALAASTIGRNSHDNSTAARVGKAILWNSMVSHLAHIFTVSANNPLQSEKKNDMRGKLHELLWFLDASLLLHIDNLQHIVVFPSHSHQDTPHVGRPTATRGFDFFLYDQKTHGNLVVQLKSKPQEHFKKPYHPLITTVHEQNFQDVNPKRLRAKLDTYRRYIQQGFDPNMEASVKRYILPSVVETIQSFTTSSVPMLDQVNSIYELGIQMDRPTTRQARRAMERKAAKVIRQHERRK